jgi:hypothetical protein
MMCLLVNDEACHSDRSGPILSFAQFCASAHGAEESRLGLWTCTVIPITYMLVSPYLNRMNNAMMRREPGASHA